eukprot:2889707-Rhodomonas_salina.2
MEQAGRTHCCRSALVFGVCLAATHVLGLVECAPDRGISLRQHVKEEFAEGCITSNVVCMVHRGGAPRTNVRGAMESLWHSLMCTSRISPRN